MDRRRLPPVLLALAVSLGASAPLARAASIESLAWMAGSWSGSQDGVAIEEHWLPPRGGLMLCMHRDVKDGRAVSFEFQRVVERNDSLISAIEARALTTGARACPRGNETAPAGFHRRGRVLPVVGTASSELRGDYEQRPL